MGPYQVSDNRNNNLLSKKKEFVATANIEIEEKYKAYNVYGGFAFSDKYTVAVSYKSTSELAEYKIKMGSINLGWYKNFNESSIVDAFLIYNYSRYDYALSGFNANTPFVVFDHNVQFESYGFGVENNFGLKDYRKGVIVGVGHKFNVFFPRALTSKSNLDQYIKELEQNKNQDEKIAPLITAKSIRSSLQMKANFQYQFGAFVRLGHKNFFLNISAYTGPKWIYKKEIRNSFNLNLGFAVRINGNNNAL